MSMKHQRLMHAARTKARLAEVTGINNPSLSSVITLIIFLVTLGWMGDALFLLVQYLFGVDQHLWGKIALGIIPFVLLTLFMWLRWQHAQRQVMKLNMESKEILAHSGVIMFLSKVRNSEHIAQLEVKNREVLEQENFTWKPCQRGLDVHKQSLQQVWVICSPESGKQFQSFRGLFSELYPHVDFMRLDVSSFEDISALVATIEDVLSNLPNGMDETDVVIDITSGQKPASIAGMMVSLMNANRQVQYVQTNAPYDVKTYAYEIKTLGKDFQS